MAAVMRLCSNVLQGSLQAFDTALFRPVDWLCSHQQPYSTAIVTVHPETICSTCVSPDKLQHDQLVLSLLYVVWPA